MHRLTYLIVLSLIVLMYVIAIPQLVQATFPGTDGQILRQSPTAEKKI